MPTKTSLLFTIGEVLESHPTSSSSSSNKRRCRSFVDHDRPITIEKSIFGDLDSSVSSSAHQAVKQALTMGSKSLRSRSSSSSSTQCTKEVDLPPSVSKGSHTLKNGNHDVETEQKSEDESVLDTHDTKSYSNNVTSSFSPKSVVKPDSNLRSNDHDSGLEDEEVCPLLNGCVHSPDYTAKVLKEESHGAVKEKKNISSPKNIFFDSKNDADKMELITTETALNISCVLSPHRELRVEVDKLSAGEICAPSRSSPVKSRRSQLDHLLESGSSSFHFETAKEAALRTANSDTNSGLTLSKVGLEKEVGAEVEEKKLFRRPPPTERPFRNPFNADSISMDDLFFSFECTPIREGWYQTYTRQDQGTEILYDVNATFDKDFCSSSMILPYEMNITTFYNSNKTVTGLRGTRGGARCKKIEKEDEIIEQKKVTSSNFSSDPCRRFEQKAKNGREKRKYTERSSIKTVENISETDSSSSEHRSLGHKALFSLRNDAAYISRRSPRAHASTRSLMGGGSIDDEINIKDGGEEDYNMIAEQLDDSMNLTALSEYDSINDGGDREFTADIAMDPPDLVDIMAFLHDRVGLPLDKPISDYASEIDDDNCNYTTAPRFSSSSVSKQTIKKLRGRPPNKPLVASGYRTKPVLKKRAKSEGSSKRCRRRRLSVVNALTPGTNSNKKRKLSFVKRAERAKRTRACKVKNYTDPDSDDGEVPTVIVRRKLIVSNASETKIKVRRRFVLGMGENSSASNAKRCYRKRRRASYSGGRRKSRK